MNQRVIAMKGYLRAPELAFHNWMQFNVIPWTRLFREGLTLLQRMQLAYSKPHQILVQIRAVYIVMRLIPS